MPLSSTLREAPSASRACTKGTATRKAFLGIAQHVANIRPRWRWVAPQTSAMGMVRWCFLQLLIAAAAGQMMNMMGNGEDEPTKKVIELTGASAVF